ncbi:MAG TPA: hypothetical protein VIN11_00680 [Roseivirga sp.]
MPEHCVDKRPDENNLHKVHNLKKCRTPPPYEHQEYLGYHLASISAERHAKRLYKKVTVCRCCYIRYPDLEDHGISLDD